MLTNKKIRLSRNLRAKVSPYPNVGSWVKRGIILLILVLVAGIYLTARPKHKSEENAQYSDINKQILGEQDRPADEAPPETEKITVKSGDTLFNISQHYGIGWEELAKLNGLQEPYILRVGQEIAVPKLK